MTNRMNFSILTEAKYTEAEKVDLLDEFLGWIQGVDGDVIEDSETIEIVDADKPANGPTEAQKNEIIQDFLNGAEFDVRLNITNGDFGFENTLS